MPQTVCLAQPSNKGGVGFGLVRGGIGGLRGGEGRRDGGGSGGWRRAEGRKIKGASRGIDCIKIGLH